MSDPFALLRTSFSISAYTVKLYSCRSQEGGIEPNLCPSRWSQAVPGALLELMMIILKSVPNLLHLVIS